MARRRSRSYPPAVWEPPTVPATGATAGVPGTWTPPGSTPPASLSDLTAGIPNAVTASPATPWTAGQYVQTARAGALGQAHWDGAAWAANPAPAGVQGQQGAEPEPEYANLGASSSPSAGDDGTVEPGP